MIKFLRKNQQFFIFFIILYGVIAVLGIYFTQPYNRYTQLPFQLPMFMDMFYSGLASRKLFFLFSTIQLVILLVNGFYLVKIGINNMIITRRSQFSALFYLAIVSLALPGDYLSGAGIACFFMLFAIDRMIGSIDKYGRTYRFLDAGLLISLGSLFYFNLLFILPFMWIAQYLLRPFSWREFSYSLIGLGLPFLYIVGMAYILDKPIADSWQYIKDWVVLDKVIIPQWPLMASLGIFGVSLLIGSLYASQKFGMTKIQARKLYQLFFFLFMNLLLILIFVPSTGLEILFLAAVPASILLSIYFTDCKPGFLNNLFFFILLATPIVSSVLLLL